MAAKETGLRELARQLSQLDRRVRSLGSTSQLAYSSIEDGAVQAYDRDGQQTMVIGKQWDGTYGPIVTSGPVPPTPSMPIVTDATEGIIVKWDGSFAGGLIPVPMDFLRVDAHVGATSDFIPDHTNRRVSFVAATGGEIGITLPEGTYYVKLVCWTLAGKVSAASDVAVGHSAAPAAGGTDGSAPTMSPAAEVLGGYEVLSVKWTPIINADPVRYQIHVSTSSGFTPSPSTLAGTSGIGGSQFIVKALPGAAPEDPSLPDPRRLQYDTTYYVQIVAEDDDGEAPAGLEGSDQIFKIQGGTIGAETIVGANILGSTITADKLSAVMTISSEFWTALAGQRVGFTPDGFFGYKPDNSLMLKIPTDGSAALYDGELIVRGATVTGGMSIQSDENELTADSAMTLMRGIVSPTASPQFSLAYDTVTPSTLSLSAADKTDILGTFDFDASQCSFIEWRPAFNMWSMYQIRTGGTREWWFNPDGTPHDISGSHDYFLDWSEYEIWGATDLTTSSDPTRNGHYFIFRWTANNDYWVYTPSGVYRYSRQNGVQPPMITNNGEDIAIAEVPTIVTPQTHLRIRYFRPVGNTGTMPAPITTYESDAGFSSGSGLCALRYNTVRFDFASSAGYMVAERGNGTNAKVIYTSGTNLPSIYPHGATVAAGWTSPNKEAGSFESPTTNRRGCDWDGTNFWTLSSDGRLYKHTSEKWDPAVTSSTVWGQLTFRDSDAGGTGTHETTPGTAKSFTWKRRSKISFTAPDVPDNGGLDDPDKIRLYMGRGSSQPTNSAMFQQYEGTATTLISTLATTGNVPPTTNSFPNANPAKIRTDDDAMVISGDGTIKMHGVDVAVGTPVIQYITSSGTWTKPANLKAAYVELVGGSGGSGGIQVYNGGTGNAQAESGAGGGGSYSAKWYLASDLSATESVTIGAAGNGGSTAGTDGTNGGSTVFKGQTAGPGLGGNGVLTALHTVNGTGASAGGNGGVATGGDINLQGGDGGHGRYINGLAFLAARGGDSPMGFGIGGNARTGAGANPGKGYGGGAGPAFAGSAAIAGAAGQQGLFKITMYF